jgi:uncharacterized protein YjbJ (UPF0337 family)
VFDQYSSATEAAIEGAQDKAKGVTKQILGTLTGRDDLVEQGRAQRAEGARLAESSREEAEIASAKAQAQRDTAFGGGESPRA